MPKKKVIKKVKATTCCKREEIIKLLNEKVPDMFDAFPRTSLTPSKVEELADEIACL